MFIFNSNIEEAIREKHTEDVFYLKPILFNIDGKKRRTDPTIYCWDWKILAVFFKLDVVFRNSSDIRIIIGLYIDD